MREGGSVSPLLVFTCSLYSTRKHIINTFTFLLLCTNVSVYLSSFSGSCCTVLYAQDLYLPQS